VNAAPEELIELIYEGPLEDPPWETFIEALRVHLEATTAAVIVRSASSPALGLLLSRGVRDFEAVYKEQYFASDPFVQLAEGVVTTLEDVMPRDRLAKTDFFRRMLEPAGVLHVLGVDLRVDRDLEMRLRVTRGPEAAGFSERDRGALQALTSHLRRALRIHGQLGRARAERDVFAGAVDHLAVGTILLDERGRIIRCNAAATRIAERGLGLVMQGERLAAAASSGTQRLDETIARALEARQRDGPGLVEALRLADPDGFDSLGVLVRALPRDERSEGGAQPAVVVFVGDPDAAEAIPSEVVRGLFGLTPAEAELATRLAAGLSLDEAAADLEIARNTARAHLRSVFEKSGVGRQADLVRLVLRSVASLG
jgi:DNA-binding CsgD family transcriptional regulator